MVYGGAGATCEDIPSYGKGPWCSTADAAIVMICTEYKAEAPWIIDPSRVPWPEGRCVKEVTRQGQHTLYKGTRPVQVILRFLVGVTARDYVGGRASCENCGT